MAYTIYVPHEATRLGEYGRVAPWRLSVLGTEPTRVADTPEWQIDEMGEIENNGYS